MNESSLTSPHGMNTACPQCGKLAADVSLIGPFARLLCLCRPCDRMWWAV